jgi:glutathione S-transferase
MIKLWFAPRTRSVRVLWLLEEMGLPYELARVTFKPTSSAFFSQSTPTGKLPVIEDGDVLMSESGAILEYLLERYDGDAKFAPAIGDPLRGDFLRWMYFSESTLYPPIGIVVWMTIYRDDADNHLDLVMDAKGRAGQGLDVVQDHLKTNDYLLGDTFCAADIMMGFTLLAADVVGVLPQTHDATRAYLARLGERPAFLTAATME